MKMKLTLNESDGLIEFEVVYSRRKTMAIKIDANGNIKVFAPKGTSRSTIGNMLNTKSDWIIKNLHEIKLNKAQEIKREYTDGESFLYLGHDYILQLNVNPELGKMKIKIADGKFLVDTPVADGAVIKGGMESWYRFMGAEHINTRLSYYQSLLDVSPSKVTIRNQKTRWGSCSSKGSLNFNWRLMMAPAEVVDYVIVHELCHLLHPNHSKNFWNQVSAILPDYRVRKDWLKRNGFRLIL
jgi:predicted metal-dependent hydrolase